MYFSRNNSKYIFYQYSGDILTWHPLKYMCIILQSCILYYSYMSEKWNPQSIVKPKLQHVWVIWRCHFLGIFVHESIPQGHNTRLISFGVQLQIIVSTLYIVSPTNQSPIHAIFIKKIVGAATTSRIIVFHDRIIHKRGGGITWNSTF
jgi:hypothetical protein